MAERHHRIHLRIIACGRSLRDIVFDRRETLNEVSALIFRADAVNIDAITILQAARGRSCRFMKMMSLRPKTPR